MRTEARLFFVSQDGRFETYQVSNRRGRVYTRTCPMSETMPSAREVGLELAREALQTDSPDDPKPEICCQAYANGKILNRGKIEDAGQIEQGRYREIINMVLEQLLGSSIQPA